METKNSSIVFLLGKYRKYSNVCLGECLTFFPFPLDSYLCLLAFPFVRAIALALKKKKIKIEVLITSKGGIMVIIFTIPHCE